MSVTLVDVSEDLLAKGRERIETSLRRVVKKQFAEDQKVGLCLLTRSVGMCLHVCLCLCVVCIVCCLCTYVYVSAVASLQARNPTLFGYFVADFLTKPLP